MMEEKRKRRKDARPSEIVQAALEVFTELGFAQAKVTDIASKAGVAKGTVYLYFKTKEELFEAVVRDFIQPVFQDVAKMVDALPGPASQLLKMLIMRLYHSLPNSPERRGILRILLSEGERFPHLTEFYHREIISGAQQLVRRIVQRGIDAGEFRQSMAGDFPATIMGPVMMAALWKMAFDRVAPLDLEAFAEAHIDLVLHGLLAE